MILASENLKKYLTVAGRSSKSFAELIGYDEQTTSQVLNRKEEPSKNFIEQVIKETGMTFDAAFEVLD